MEAIASASSSTGALPPPVASVSAQESMRPMGTLQRYLPAYFFNEEVTLRRHRIKGWMLLVNIVASAFAGYCSAQKIWRIAIPATCVELLSFLCLVRAMGIKLGLPHMRPGQLAVHFALQAPAAILGFFGCHGLYDGYGLKLLVAHYFVTFAGVGLGCRRAYAVTNAFILPSLFLQGSDQLSLVPAFGVTLYVCKVPVVWFTEYLQDELVILFTANASTCTFFIFGLWANELTDVDFRGPPILVVSLFSAVPVVMIYLWFLLERRQRYFPAGLQHAQFIKLSYLRKMYKHRYPITRLQELPKEAFGDARKALWLVTASHRWLDRYSCDVPSEEHPAGVRLTTMLQKLDDYFSLRGFGRGQGLRDRWRRIGASLTGGTDVLIFFDFMCIPQIGRDKNGDAIPRTRGEERIFQQVLPSMPTLYSTTEVCVFPVVAEGLAPYEDSGWCFCERVVASLGGRLQFFSPEYDLTSAKECDVCERLGSDCVAYINGELASKQFLYGSDRQLVQTLVSDFMLKRRFHDAIRDGDLELVVSLLRNVQGHREFVLVNSAVDSNFNTPLHLAVMARSVAITELLLQHGAWCTSRNRRGDTPMQWCMIPRMNGAARLCMRKQGNDMDVDNTAPTATRANSTSSDELDTVSVESALSEL